MAAQEIAALAMSREFTIHVADGSVHLSAEAMSRESSAAISESSEEFAATGLGEQHLSYASLPILDTTIFASGVSEFTFDTAGIGFLPVPVHGIAPLEFVLFANTGVLVKGPFCLQAASIYVGQGVIGTYWVGGVGEGEVYTGYVEEGISEC